VGGIQVESLSCKLSREFLQLPVLGLTKRKGGKLFIFTVDYLKVDCIYFARRVGKFLLTLYFLDCRTKVNTYP
jgi:hypothetical protein